MRNGLHLIIVSCALMWLGTMTSYAEQPKGHSMNSPNTLNRLAQEKSPYLLQHAANPVDWYPWSDEAFDKARREDKPVFLSIGYSTCHWCHVMEGESFENDAIAKYLNEHFVAIKVDREERPDVDQIYMSAVQTMTGHGGWPLSVFLSPDRKPFFGGTYFPPYAKWGSPGFMDVLVSIDQGWRTDRDKLIKSGEALTGMLSQNLPGQSGADDLSPDIFKQAFGELQRAYDNVHGGFGNAPKFPTSHTLSFLLRYWNRERNEAALTMVTQTLQQMAAGGMYDHLGGGFHRYSTDREWQIPHFEKMLYDQAILARTYLEAYQITRDPFYARISRETFGYCLRDLRDANGAFHSAEDADSLDPYEFTEMSPDPSQKYEKKEGAFFLWTKEQIGRVLPARDAEVFGYYYGIQTDGNAKSDPHGEFGGRNVLAAARSVDECARKFQINPDEVYASLDRSRAVLFPLREERPRPHLDDKVLVDWNGLLISSLAIGSRVLHEPAYLDAAEEAARFIVHNMIKDGRLLHRYRDGEAAIPGMLDDYAFFANGLIDLYEATFNVDYLEKAVELQAVMRELFTDDQNGGFYLTAADTQDLIFRPREIYDGAIPSGNSVAALVMVRLYHMSFEKAYLDHAQKLFKAFAKNIRQRPSAYTQLLIAFDFAVGPAQEIVIAGPRQDPGIKQMADIAYANFLPNRVLIYRDSEEDGLQATVRIAPFIRNQPPIDGKPTVYFCENSVCKKPTNNVAEFQTMLKATTKQE